MPKKTISIWMVLMLSAILFASCKGKPPKPKDPPKTENKVTGEEGTISGVVKFDGTPAPPKKIDMGADANCASAAGSKMTDDVLVADGKLANVFVYLKGGKLETTSFQTPSTPVTLDQNGCRYHPRVMGIQINQTFRVVNSDPTTHNVHPTPKFNTEWNQSQTQGQPPIEQKFARPETLVPVKCNQHPWMKAHIGVLAHPFFAVSENNGSYSIKGVPPGTYTVVFWHETYGEQTASVTVGAKESKTQDYTFKQGTAYAPTSLEVQPVLVLP